MPFPTFFSRRRRASRTPRRRHGSGCGAGCCGGRLQESAEQAGSGGLVEPIHQARAAARQGWRTGGGSSRAQRVLLAVNDLCCLDGPPPGGATVAGLGSRTTRSLAHKKARAWPSLCSFASTEAKLQGCCCLQILAPSRRWPPWQKRWWKTLRRPRRSRANWSRGERSRAIARWRTKIVAVGAPPRACGACRTRPAWLTLCTPRTLTGGSLLWCGPPSRTSCLLPATLPAPVSGAGGGALWSTAGWGLPLHAPLSQPCRNKPQLVPRAPAQRAPTPKGPAPTGVLLPALRSPLAGRRGPAAHDGPVGGGRGTRGGLRRGRDAPQPLGGVSDRGRRR